MGHIFQRTSDPNDPVGCDKKWFFLWIHDNGIDSLCVIHHGVTLSPVLPHHGPIIPIFLLDKFEKLLNGYRPCYLPILRQDDDAYHRLVLTSS